MKIRQATQSDFQDIASIHVDSWKDSYSNVLPTEFLTKEIDKTLAQHWSEIEIQDEDIILVAEQDSLIGFIAVWCRPIPFIDNLHVRLPYRSQKVGYILMRSVAQELINNGHKSAYLWVFESNKKAIRFYERLGGIQKEKALKTVCGYDVPSRKIEWNNLAVICEGQ